MNIKYITLLIICLLLQTFANAKEYFVITKLDSKLIGDDKSAAVDRFMKEHSINSTQMMSLLDENIREQLQFTGNEDIRDCAASTTLITMSHTDVKESLPRLLKYSGQDYPETLRSTAITLYIQHAGNAGFVLATNVMTQPWRSSSEHNRIRMEYYAQAKAASSKDREKHIDFLKWAVTHCVFGNWAAWDDNIVELDPSWRSNELRKAAAELQKQRITTPTGTNNIIEIIRDYELASGLLKPEPPPAAPESPEAAVSESGKITASTRMQDTATQPIEHSPSHCRRALTIGVGVMVVLAVFVFWKFRHR